MANRRSRWGITWRKPPTSGELRGGRQSGFDVHTASDGREGVDVVRQISPDIVTLDVGLPDINGIEVLRRIRKFSAAYIVMLTGRDDEAVVSAALQAGADDYITKPFRPRELRSRIGMMMQRQLADRMPPGPIS
nr:response regulator [Arthrobacter liuii]